MGREGELRVELEHALQRLLEQGCAEAYVARIASLVMTNLARGRVDSYLDDCSTVKASDYVDLVTREYDAQHIYVERVQVDKDAAVWEPLFEQLKKWAYNLIRSRLQSNPHQERMIHAVNCASDAGAAIVNSYFPYDTAFEAWIYVLLNYTVNRYIRGLPGFRDNGPPEVPLDEWPDWSANLVDPCAETALSQLERQQMLAQAISELPPGQQEVIALLFGTDSFSYKEIAKRTGRSYSALYKSKFDALENLRQILSGADYMRV